MSINSIENILDSFKRLVDTPFFSKEIVTVPDHMLTVETALGLDLYLRSMSNKRSVFVFNLSNESEVVASSFQFSIEDLDEAFMYFMTSFLITNSLKNGGNGPDVSCLISVFGSKAVQASRDVHAKIDDITKDYFRHITKGWLDKLEKVILDNSDFYRVFHGLMPISVDLNEDASRRIILSGTSQMLRIVFEDDNERTSELLYLGPSSKQPEFVLEKVKNLVVTPTAAPSPR